MHGHRRHTDTKLDAHIAYLHTLDIFGISDHDLMFNVEEHHEDDEAEMDEGNDYIQSRVQKAQELLHMESNLSSDLREQLSKYPRSVDVDPSLKPPRPPKQKTSPREPNSSVPEVISIDSSPPSEPVHLKHEIKASPEGDSANTSQYECLSADSDNDSFHSPQGQPTQDQDAVIPQLHAQALSVQGVFPDMPLNVIMDDLRMTKSADDTINNILEGRLVTLPTLDEMQGEVGENAEADDSMEMIPASPSDNDDTPGCVNPTPHLTQSIPGEKPSTPTGSLSPLSRIRSTPTGKQSTSGRKPLTPLAHVGGTPKHLTPNCRSVERLIHEQILISPDPSRPIIKMEPLSCERVQPFFPPRRFRHNSSDPIVCPLEASIYESPSPLKSVNAALHTTVVEDSPDPDELCVRQPAASARRLSRMSVGNPRASLAIVLDSVENSPIGSDLEGSCSDLDRVYKSDNDQEEDLVGVVEDSDNSEAESESRVFDTSMSKTTSVPVRPVQQSEDVHLTIEANSLGIDKEDQAEDLMMDTNAVRNVRSDDSDQDRELDEARPRTDEAGQDCEEAVQDSSHSSMEVAGYGIGNNGIDSDEDGPVQRKVIKSKTLKSKAPVHSEEHEEERDSNSDSNKESSQREPTKMSVPKNSRMSGSSSQDDNSEAANSDEDKKSGSKTPGTKQSRIVSSEEEFNSKLTNSDDEKSQRQNQKNKHSATKKSRISSSSETEAAEFNVKESRSKESEDHRARNIRSANKKNRILSSEEENSDTNISKKADRHEQGSKRSGGKNTRISSSEEKLSSDDGENVYKQSKKKTKKSVRRVVESCEEDGGDNSGSDGDGTADIAEEQDESPDDESNTSSFIDDCEEDADSSSEGEHSEYGESSEDQSESRGEADVFEDEKDGSEDDGSGEEEEDASGEEDSEEEGEIPEELQKRYSELEAKARKLYRRQKYEEALVNILEALEIHADEGLQALALKIHQKMNN